MMPTPRSRRRRKATNRRATSSAGRLAVGSSSTRISASAASARAIATSDFSVRLRLWMRTSGIDVSVEHIKGSCGALPRRPPVDQAAAPRIAEGEAYVLGHRHPVDQAEVLMDERNRQTAQHAGRVVPAELYAAGIQRVDAGEDLDQRGLACAVLAEQRQDLAGAELEVNVIERERAPEALGDAPEFQHRCALRAGRSIRRQSGRRGAQVRIASRSQPARPGRASRPLQSRPPPYLWASVEGCPCFSVGG